MKELFLEDVLKLTGFNKTDVKKNEHDQRSKMTINQSTI